MTKIRLLLVCGVMILQTSTSSNLYAIQFYTAEKKLSITEVITTKRAETKSGALTPIAHPLDGITIQADETSPEIPVLRPQKEDFSVGPYGYESVTDCRERRGIASPLHNSPAPPGFDSDGDGIFDNDEDTNYNCLCDCNETCWYARDTDFDGIEDKNDSCPLDPTPNCTGSDPCGGGMPPLPQY